MFVILSVYTWQQQPAAIVALVLIAAASFIAEWAYRRWTGRVIKDLGVERQEAESRGNKKAPQLRGQVGEEPVRNRRKKHANPLHCAAGSFAVPYTRSGFS